MRDLSRQHKAFHDFPCIYTIYRGISTTFRVGRLRFLRSAQPVLLHPVAQLLRVHAQQTRRTPLAINHLMLMPSAVNPHRLIDVPVIPPASTHTPRD